MVLFFRLYTMQSTGLFRRVDRIADMSPVDLIPAQIRPEYLAKKK